jgi:hypothetical protein
VTKRSPTNKYQGNSETLDDPIAANTLRQYCRDLRADNGADGESDRSAKTVVKKSCGEVSGAAGERRESQKRTVK